MALIQSAQLVIRYSGGTHNEDPDWSLGGAMSLYEVPDGVMHALFPRIPYSENISGEVRKYRWVYLLNLSDNVNGLTDGGLFIESQPGPGLVYRIGIGSLNSTPALLADERTAPVGVTFYEAAGYENAIALPSPIGYLDRLPIAVERTMSIYAPYQDAASCLIRGFGTTV